jgi:hypothetical protein
MKKYILIIVFACMSIGCATTGSWSEGAPVDIEIYYEWRGGDSWLCYRSKPTTMLEYTEQFRCNKIVQPAEVSSNQKIGM